MQSPSKNGLRPMLMWERRKQIGQRKKVGIRASPWGLQRQGDSTELWSVGERERDFSTLPLALMCSVCYLGQRFFFSWGNSSEADIFVLSNNYLPASGRISPPILEGPPGPLARFLGDTNEEFSGEVVPWMMRPFPQHKENSRCK